MQSAVIAAFFHCCSSNQNPMHGQCPTGKDSWCKYKQALRDGKSDAKYSTIFMDNNAIPHGTEALQKLLKTVSNDSTAAIDTTTGTENSSTDP
ncbi:hypothetical protein TNCV_2202351 [Trichonephila clavipes]|uniref:Uncharacterized protein n=1 Tax=Trichonephila clavipes TaxID=2585209 RepID=A0A8X6R6N4_TRICX|nr:hypothetical protein TNCV_2202351 [Trichonephila clavipes]